MHHLNDRDILIVKTYCSSPRLNRLCTPCGGCTSGTLRYTFHRRRIGTPERRAKRWRMKLIRQLLKGLDFFIPTPCTYTTFTQRWQGEDIIFFLLGDTKIMLFYHNWMSISFLPPDSREEKKTIGYCGKRTQVYSLHSRPGSTVPGRPWWKGHLSTIFGRMADIPN